MITRYSNMLPYPMRYFPGGLLLEVAAHVKGVPHLGLLIEILQQQREDTSQQREEIAPADLQK
jgi:hypothetical protein